MQTNRKYDYKHTGSGWMGWDGWGGPMQPTKSKKRVKGLEDDYIYDYSMAIARFGSCWHNLNSCQFDKVTHEGQKAQKAQKTEEEKFLCDFASLPLYFVCAVGI